MVLVSMVMLVFGVVKQLTSTISICPKQVNTKIHQQYQLPPLKYKICEIAMFERMCIFQNIIFCWYYMLNCSGAVEVHQYQPSTNGGFLKWWYPTTMGFPIKNDHFVL